MKLYHGSNMEIDKIDLSKCMPNKDFGCGFFRRTGMENGEAKNKNRWRNPNGNDI